jgi:protein disulfide-isomerase A6
LKSFRRITDFAVLQFLQGAETLKKVVMRRAMGMLQILVLLVAIVNGMSLASALYGPSSDVVILTSSNFKSKVLQADGVVLVEFFANWCGHCKNLAPQWEKVATALKGIVTVAAVDADTHRDLAQVTY